MAYYFDLLNGIFRRKQSISASTGVTDADKLISTDAGGFIDKSFFESIGARVYHSVDQSFANGAYAALAFNSERYDTDTIHSNVTSNSRLTCKTAGKYLIGGWMSFAASGIGARQGSIVLNGSATLDAEIIAASGTGSNTALSLSTVYELAVNDYVQLYAYQGSGMSLNVSNPEFYMHRLS